MQLKPILTLYEKVAQDAMRKAAREELKRARELSPTLSGKSDKSGFTRVDDLTVQVGFTSIVSKLNHENLDWQHPQGGQSKFLETAADEIDIGKYVAAAAREHLNG